MADQTGGGGGGGGETRDPRSNKTLRSQVTLRSGPDRFDRKMGLNGCTRRTLPAPQRRSLASSVGPTENGPLPSSRDPGAVKGTAERLWWRVAR